MNSILRKASATIKMTKQEYALMEKALMEYYWNDKLDQQQRKVIRYMLTDIQISRAVEKQM